MKVQALSGTQARTYLFYGLSLLRDRFVLIAQSRERSPTRVNLKAPPSPYRQDAFAILQHSPSLNYIINSLLSRTRDFVISLLQGTSRNDSLWRLNHRITHLLPKPSISPSSLCMNVPVNRRYSPPRRKPRLLNAYPSSLLSPDVFYALLQPLECLPTPSH